jgi:hypothetical protein
MTSQQGRTRRWFLLVGILGVAACRDTVAPRALTPPDPAAIIVDGAHNSGNDDVFFLPPLVDNPSNAAGFGDPEQLGLPVNIKINCLSHTATSACPNFDFPPSAVKSSSDSHYMVNWDTKTPGVDPGDVYRVEIHVGDKTLAWADVFLVPNGNPKNVATQGDIPLPDGRTLPIKIRIEKGWDCTNRSNKSQCATQVVPNVAVDGSGSTIVQFAGTDAEPAGGGRFYDGWIPYSANCQPRSTTCVPTGTPVVVTIEDQTSLLNASGATCSLKNSQSGVPVTKMLTQLGTGNAQHPGRCVKFTTNPKFEFAKRVDVAVCVESPTPTQQLLKYDIGETPRFLQNVFFPIVCEPSTVGSTTRSRSANPAINYALNTLSRAGHALSEFFTPKSAYAIHLGVGGLIPPGGNGGGFSFVAPAEPYTESVVGEYEQTAAVNTPVPGPQSRITTVHPTAAPAVGQNVRCEITSGGGSLGSLGGPTDSVVQTQAVRNDAGAIVDAVATCPAWYLGPTPGANTLQMVALSIDDGTQAAQDDGEGGSEIETLHGVTTFTATGTDDAAGGDDMVVINDINPFMESMTSANNQRLVRNLVTFTNDSPRSAGTKVWFDKAADGLCNTRNEAGAPVYTCGQPGAFDAFRSALIAGSIQSVVDVSSSDTESPLSNIPSDVKVIVLLAPQTNYTPNEVNSLRRFGLDGGRIVFIGDNTVTVYGDGLGAENDLLQQFGSYIQGIPNSALLSGNNSPVSQSAIQSSPITAGLTGLLFGGAGALQVPVDTWGTPLIVLDGNVLMAVMPIFDT